MIELDDYAAPRFRVPQVADYLEVSEATVRKMAQSGMIETARRCKGGDWKFSKKHIEEFVNGGNTPEKPARTSR